MLKWLTDHKPEFSKLIVGWLLLNSTAWIWCSYGLARMGMPDIAETLSKTVVAEVLGVMALYSIKAAVENLSKNNQWPDKKPKDTDRDC